MSFNTASPSTVGVTEVEAEAEAAAWACSVEAVAGVGTLLSWRPLESSGGTEGGGDVLTAGAFTRGMGRVGEEKT